MESNLDDYRKDFNIRQFNNLLRYHEDLLDILKKNTSFLDEHNPSNPERVYCWYNNITENRLNYTKSKLVSLGYDKHLTEIEIMHSLKYYRIFGPGNLKFIYKKVSP